jgi:hypothetical protein
MNELYRIVILWLQCYYGFSLHRSMRFDENGARLLLIFVGGKEEYLVVFAVEVCAVAVRDQTGNITANNNNTQKINSKF